MLDNFIVVDYYEGAGGEFMANWLSAHFGHVLYDDAQTNPVYCQKWFNSHSLIKPDWNYNFANYVQDFLIMCEQQNIKSLAVSYHLYKWPDHVKILSQVQARFVKINSQGHEKQIRKDFDRKVLQRLLTKNDLPEVLFALKNQPQIHVDHCLNLLREGTLTWGDLRPRPQFCCLQPLPSQDIEIFYNDFFVDFGKTQHAYLALCDKLHLLPRFDLLDALIERNKKNLAQQNL